MLALLLNLFSTVALAAPSSEGEMPDINKQLMNYGTISVFEGNLPDSIPKSLTLFKCQTEFGFPIPHGCNQVAKTFSVNERVNVPTGWYLLQYNHQALPVLIMPEGRIQNPPALPSLVNFDWPVDQVSPLGKLVNGTNHRTELTLRFRQDFRDADTLHSALFALTGGFDREFNWKRQAFIADFCNDFSAANSSSTKVRLQIQMCQALQGGDPTNLLDSVVQVSPDGQLKLRTTPDDTFTPLDKMNEVIATVKTGTWTAALPGSYLLKARNNSLDQESDDWLRVTAGKSSFLPLYKTERNWKALRLRTAERYWLVHHDKSNFGVWNCPNSANEMVGSTSTLNKINRECVAIRLNARTPDEFQALSRALQQNYDVQARELEVKIKESHDLLKDHETNLLRLVSELSSLTDRAKELELKLRDNLYFKTEKEIAELEKRLANLGPEKALIEAQIAEWMRNAPGRIQEMIKGAPDYLVIGVGSVFGLGATALGGVLIAVGLANPLTAGPLLAGAAIGTLGLNAGFEAIENIKYRHRLSNLQFEYDEISKCFAHLERCPLRLPELGTIIKRWKQIVGGDIHAINRLAELKELRKTQPYLKAKALAASDERELQSTLETIAQRKIQIASLNDIVATLKAEISTIQEKLNPLYKRIYTSLSISIAFEELLKDSRYRITRHLLGDWELYKDVMEELSSL